MTHDPTSIVLQWTCLIDSGWVVAPGNWWRHPGMDTPLMRRQDALEYEFDTRMQDD